MDKQEFWGVVTSAFIFAGVFKLVNFIFAIAGLILQLVYRS
jgi:hypothetical protein